MVYAQTEFSRRGFLSSVAASLAILVGTLLPRTAWPMTENLRYLNDARARLKEFETEREPERLREAWVALDNVILAQEEDTQTRAALRKDCLYLRLQMFRLVDRFLDPNFDAKDVPYLNIAPPPTRDGIAYDSGVDPSEIKDPETRAAYEKALAENRAKAEYHRLQIGLRRVDERITPSTEAFIRNAYRAVSGDQTELTTAIDEVIENPRRKADLLKLLPPSSRPM
jgi:hypothetical protein